MNATKAQKKAYLYRLKICKNVEIDKTKNIRYSNYETI